MPDRFIFETSRGALASRAGRSKRAAALDQGVELISSTALLRWRRIGEELRDPQQAVAADREGGHEAGTAQSHHAHLAQGAGVFAPAKDLLDPLAQSLAGQVPRVTGGARIDRRTTLVSDVLRHMRGDTQLAAVGHEVAHVIALVARYGACTLALEHPQRSFPFGQTRRFGDLHVHRHSLAVLHEHMPHVVELGGMILALAKELRLRLVRGHVRFVRAPLAMEVHVRIASRGRWIILAVAPAHALDRRPRLNEGAVDAEVLRGHKPLAPGTPADAPQQLSGHARLN